MLSKQDIIASLNKIGAPRDKVVIVHTSLRKIGNIEGGAEALLDALIEYFTADGGLLCIPAHTWGYQDDKSVPTLDLCNPRSSIGTLPDIASRDSRGIRTLHPSHSMMVFGNKDKVLDFVSGEEKVETTASPDGCYGKIYKMGGYVLLLGVGQDKNTFLHCVEEMLGVNNRIDYKKPISLTIKHLDGHIEERKLYQLYSEGILDVSMQFPNYEPAFRKHGCIVDGMMGNAKAQLCDVVKMKDVMSLIYERSNGEELLKDLTPINEEFY